VKSAAALLARIKAEREQTQAVKKKLKSKNLGVAKATPTKATITNRSLSI